MQLEAKSIIDLTQTISENLEVYPGDPPVEVHTVSTLEDGFVLERVCMSSHGGTHLDAPWHVLKGGADVSSIALERLILPCVYVDMSALSKKEDRLAKLTGRFTDLKDKALLLSTNEKLSANITPEEVEVLITGGVKLLGVDAMSVEHSDDLVVHKQLLSSGVLIVEGLANLHMLNEKQEYFLVVAPLKLEGCSGAPVRAFAITL
ncbi:MAG TPA: cyclase family protein [Coprothermobacter proteolyticus]|nr:cyclase family protein [Coprothermobacter proteolyticus]